VKQALVDRYAVERELGSGGMATVYLARDLKHDRLVAIKVLRPDLAASLGADRFLQEIRVTAQLSNPHILPLLDSGESDGVLYYVMPFVEDESLRELLKREGALSIERALDIARDVAVALEHAHRAGVVHRDIKPENILLHGDEAVVADFGIARAVSAAGGERLTQTGLAVGTPKYMSPEQASGDASVDGRTDVYSLGAVLYEMLAGEPPFTGPNLQAIIAKQLVDPVPSARRVRDTIPESVDAAIRKALAKAPVDRFQTAREFVDALAVEPAAVTGESAAHQRSWWGGLSLFVIALFAIGAISWAVTRDGGGPAVSATQVAVLPFSMRGSTDLAYLGDGMVDLLSVKLDGAGSLRTADPRAVLAATERRGSGAPDPATGRAIAEELGAGMYVLGSIVEVGGRLQFDASLYDPSRGDTPVAQASAEGVPAEVLALVDDLAGELLAGQGVLQGTRLSRLALLTTDSLTALKSYLRGSSHYRAGRFREAAAAFEDAIAVDSSFALAWYQLSVTADWLLRSDVALEAAERATRHAERLPERDRRLLEALVTVRRGDGAAAERQYRAILGTYPDDVEAWFQLGEVLFHFHPRLGGDIEESSEAWERIIAIEPDYPTAYVHLARIALTGGDDAELDSMVAQVVARFPTGTDRALELRTLQAMARDDATERASALVELETASDDDLAEITWSAASFAGRLPEAHAIAGLMAAPSRSAEARALGHVWRAYLQLAWGRWSQAKAELVLAGALDPALTITAESYMALSPFLQIAGAERDALRRRLAAWDAARVPESASHNSFFSVHNGVYPHIKTYLMGLLNAGLGREAEAQQQASRLGAAAPDPRLGSLTSDLRAGVLAELALEAGREDDALSALEGMPLAVWHQLHVSSPFFSAPRERYLRAVLLDQADRTEEAALWYGSFDEVAVHDLAYLAPAQLRLARMYERTGDLAGAVRHYTEFVRLWSEADPELQGVVEDARSRITALRESVGD
jgi:tetratricopeptide (TPR) repeat protein